MERGENFEEGERELGKMLEEVWGSAVGGGVEGQRDRDCGMTRQTERNG